MHPFILMMNSISALSEGQEEPQLWVGDPETTDACLPTVIAYAVDNDHSHILFRSSPKNSLRCMQNKIDKFDVDCKHHCS